jgi:hypothetical protein
MGVKDAIAKAKAYIRDIYADEQVTALTLEEVEHDPSTGAWIVTIGFSRPWSSPRTIVQEALENTAAVTILKRANKVVTMSEDGTVISMKNYAPRDAAE